VGACRQACLRAAIRCRELFAALSADERHDLEGEARELGGALVSPGHTAALRGIMEGLLLRRANIPTYEEWVESRPGRY